MLAAPAADQPKERDRAEGHKPGEKVQTRGIYKVVREGDAGSGFEVTCVEGGHFPPAAATVRTTSWFTARRREGDVL
ncbi:hypothetical protein SAMN05445850_6265 [Paraburkholderia tuberum]|uniref:Uncharacterized protein n=1 Tax=Paraburkholderia tuberum TaxID=157910 RepID=A0A1H1K194_9BURK|nr:hypothetical protein SAMN05445850_6265 [Paraburkholderia tuberum]